MIDLLLERIKEGGTDLPNLVYYYVVLGGDQADLPIEVLTRRDVGNAIAAALGPKPDLLLRLDRLRRGESPRGAAFEIGFHSAFLEEGLAHQLMGEFWDEFHQDFLIGRVMGQGL